jgi:hypothetical protein
MRQPKPLRCRPMPTDVTTDVVGRTSTPLEKLIEGIAAGA